MESVFDRYLPIDVQIAAASPLEGLGVMVRLITVQRAGHAFDNFARATDTKTSKSWSTDLAPIFAYFE
jgi:hypothetical protein